MSAWIVIVESDLNDYLVAAQMDALKTVALASGQADPFGKIMADVVNRMRLKIASCSRNRLSATGLSIPPELKWIACYLIVEAMQVRLKLKFTEDFKTQLSEAKKQLDRIADCKDVVSTADDAEAVSEAQAVNGPLSSRRCLEFSREKQDGL